MKKLMSFMYLPMFCLLSMCTCNAQCESKQYDHVARDPVLYNSKGLSFEKFLSWSNEKQKTAEEILKVVGDHKKSLLDIGAGNGILTKILSSHFDHVTAIEPGPVLFETLKRMFCSNTHTLINLPFEKVTLQNKFDVIVASHVLKFIPNPYQEIFRMRDLLADDGLLLLINHDRKSDFLKFYHRYKKDVLGTSSSSSVPLDYKNLLGEAFKVKEVYFTATLTIPSVDDFIGILDFFYDVELSTIKKETLMKIREDLQKEYGSGSVTINLQQVMYICSK